MFLSSLWCSFTCSLCSKRRVVINLGPPSSHPHESHHAMKRSPFFNQLTFSGRERLKQLWKSNIWVLQRHVRAPYQQVRNTMSLLTQNTPEPTHRWILLVEPHLCSTACNVTHHLIHYKEVAKVSIIREILTCNMYFDVSWPQLFDDLNFTIWLSNLFDSERIDEHIVARWVGGARGS